MDSRFASVRSDGDPRFPAMLVAVVADPRDMAAFPIGAPVEHDGVAMRVVGRDPNARTIRIRPNPAAVVKPAGKVHLADGFEDDDRTCGDAATGSLSTNVDEVTCAACLDTAQATAAALASRYATRRAALEAP